MSQERDKQLLVLASAEFVAQNVTAAYARHLDMQMVAVEMLKHGLSLLTGVPADQCAEPVQEMLNLYRRTHMN